MCIIAVKPKEKPLFSKETIRQMFLANPDGAGLMYLRPDGKIHIEKGFFDVNELFVYIEKNRPALEKTDVILHFRIATSGRRDALGCHPYPVWTANRSTSCDVSLGMVHNGILDSYGFRGTEEVNDTQIFIKECLRRLPHNFLRNRAICDMLSRSVNYGYRNCLAFLGRDGFCLLGGEFIEDDGYFYSNESYKPPKWLFGYSRNKATDREQSKEERLPDGFAELLEKMGKAGFDDYLRHLFGRKTIVCTTPKNRGLIRHGLQLYYRLLDDELPEVYYDDAVMYTLYSGHIERHDLSEEDLNDAFYNEQADIEPFSLGI